MADKCTKVVYMVSCACKGCIRLVSQAPRSAVWLKASAHSSHPSRLQMTSCSVQMAAYQRNMAACCSAEDCSASFGFPPLPTGQYSCHGVIRTLVQLFGVA